MDLYPAFFPNFELNVIFLCSEHLISRWYVWIPYFHSTSRQVPLVVLLRCKLYAYSYNYRTNPTVEDVESLDKASLSDEIGPLTQENRKCPCDSCEDGTAAICFCLSCGLKYCDKHQQVMKHLKYWVITDIAQSPTLGSIMSQFFNIEKMSTIGY